MTKKVWEDSHGKYERGFFQKHVMHRIFFKHSRFLKQRSMINTEISFRLFISLLMNSAGGAAPMNNTLIRLKKGW